MAICLVSGKLVRANSAPIQGAVVGWKVDVAGGEVLFIDGEAVSVDDEFTVLTAPDGTWAINLIQGAKMRINIIELGLHRQVTIPAQVTATLEELLNGDI